jgi:glycosyltransferase 2 family protein
MKSAATRLVVSLLIAGGFAWAMRRGGVPFVPPNAWGGLAWWGLPAYIALLGAAVFLRTSRWYYLLEPLSPRLRRWRVFGVGLLGFSAVFFAPLRLGEMVRPYTLSQDGDVTFVEALGTVAAERIIDGLVMVCLTALALAASTPLVPAATHLGALPIPVSLVPGAIVAAFITFVSGFAAMVVFYFARDTARRIVSKILGVVSLRLALFCSNVVERLAESLAFLPSWQRVGPFLRETVLYWLAMAAAQYSLMRAVGLDATLAQAMVLVGVGSLGSLLPAGPGFFGAFQVSTYTALAMYHHETAVLGAGAVFVFFSYLGVVLINALQFVVGMVLLARIPASPEPT